MREWIRDIGLRLTAPFGVGAVLGLIGPFGTYDLLPVLPRLGYWLAVVSLNWALADAVIRRVEAMAGDRLPAPRLSMPTLGALIVSVPATGVVVLANGLSGIGWPSSVATLYGQVLILLTAISLPVYAWGICERPWSSRGQTRERAPDQAPMLQMQLALPCFSPGCPARFQDGCCALRHRTITLPSTPPAAPR